MDFLKLYIRYVILTFKSEMEYKVTFYFGSFVQMLSFVASYFTIFIIMNKFNNIKGWGLYEVLFLYSLNVLSYGFCALVFWSPMLRLESKVQSGEFDVFLCKPMRPMLHIISKELNYVFINNIIIAIVVFCMCFTKLNIHWSIQNIFWFLLVILGGILIQASIFIMSGSICFWFTKSGTVVNTAIYSIRNFINYPITIYGKGIQILLTFIIPYAFVNFYPSQLFLSKSGTELFNPVFKFCTPIVGGIMFALALFIWKSGINRYESTGS
jgi:ABC-2 type transport system permease protein